MLENVQENNEGQRKVTPDSQKKRFASVGSARDTYIASLKRYIDKNL